MRELPLAAAIERRDVEIVEMLEIVGQVSHHAGLRVEVEAANGALAGGHRRHVCARRGRRGTPASVPLTPVSKRSSPRARSPVQIRRDQVEIVHRQRRFRAARRPAPGRAWETAAAAVCPAKAICLPSGDQRGCVSSNSWSEILVSAPPSRRDHPDILVVAAVVLLAGAVGDERDARANRATIADRYRSSRRRR